MSNIKTRIAIIAALIVLSLGLVATKALAKQGDECRPGWGNGDPNHCHVGPPGSTQPTP